MLFKAVLFDLDGTLLDTAPDFILSMNLLLSKYDKPLITESEIRSSVTNGSEGLIKKAFKIDSTHENFAAIKKEYLEIYYENISQNSLRKFRERVNQEPIDSNLYGLALAHQKNNNYKESLELINKLITVYPKNLILNNTKVDFLFESGEYEDALVHVNKFLEISPRNYPLSISKSKILLSMERYFESEEIIRDQLLRKNNNPDLWLLLSEIQRSSKNIIGYHQSRAEYFLLLGQNERALNQLEFALKLTQNNFQVSERIMTKMVEIKKEINESRGL